MSLPFRNPNPDKVSDEDLRDLAKFAHTLADASREVISPLFRSDLKMDNKRTEADFDPVTDADRGAERAIRSLVEEYYPEHSIFGEEFGYKEGTSSLTWTLDPIDGTRPFALGFPSWGTLIALHDGAKPILGVLDQPFLTERFIGARQIGLADHISRRGRVQLKARNCQSLSMATLSSTHPSMFRTEKEVAACAALEKAVKLQVYGGDCYAYGVIGLGTHDLVVEAMLAPYDIQALIPVVEAAGGIVTDWAGGPADLGGAVIAAGSKSVHTEALKILKTAL